MSNELKCIKSFKEIKCSNCDSNGYFVKNGKAIKCDCRKKYEEDLKLCDRLLRSGILSESSDYQDFENIKNYNFDKYIGNESRNNITKLEKFVSEFDNEDKPFKHIHFYVWGNQGTQKSTVMKNVCKELSNKGFSTYYIFAKDLISLIMDSERDENARLKLSELMKVDFLVIDEFNEKRINLYTSSSYKENSSLVWIKERLEICRKSTAFISNSSLQEIKEGKLGDLYGDLLIRETRFGNLEFKDKFVFDTNSKEFQDELASIWD